MKMTMTQKSLAAHAGKDVVRPGELVMARLDLVLGNDITAPVAIREFPKFGRANVFDRRKIALVPDHFSPNKDIKAAAQCAAMRRSNWTRRASWAVPHSLLARSSFCFSCQ